MPIDIDENIDYNVVTILSYKMEVIYEIEKDVQE